MTKQPTPQKMIERIRMKVLKDCLDVDEANFLNKLWQDCCVMREALEAIENNNNTLWARGADAMAKFANKAISQVSDYPSPS